MHKYPSAEAALSCMQQFSSGVTKIAALPAGKLSVPNGLPSHRPSQAVPSKAQSGKAGSKDKAQIRREKQLQEEAAVGQLSLSLLKTPLRGGIPLRLLIIS